MACVVLLGAYIDKSVAAETLYNSGYAEMKATDPVTGQEVRAAIWYPTRRPASLVKKGPFSLSVALDEPAASGSFPLIAISHGNTGSHLGHRDSAMDLAKSGYIVISPLHIGDNFLERNLLGTETLLKSRPKSVSALIDTLLSDKRFSADPKRIGFVGFSAGGYTGLALLGAKPAFAQAEKHCEKYPQDNFCKFAPKNAGDPVPIANLQDTRIKAAVLLAPLTAQYTDETLSSVKAPVYLMQAEFDQILTEPFHSARLIKSGANIQEIWKVENAQHYSFIAPFPEIMRGELGEISEDRLGFDRTKIHKMMNERIIAFFEKNI